MGVDCGSTPPSIETPSLSERLERSENCQSGQISFCRQEVRAWVDRVVDCGFIVLIVDFSLID